jgi:hypothetical protein
MSDRPLAVLDTNVLLNLATPVVDGREQAPSGEDPLRVALTVYDVHVPDAVVGELAEASDDDLLATAAEAVLSASHHLTTHDVEAELDDALEYGLDLGESHGIWLANELDATLFVTDEFRSTNFALISLELDDPETLFTTPHLLCALAERGHLDGACVDAALTYLLETKQWASQYVERLRTTYL